MAEWYIYYKIPKLSGDKMYRAGPYSADDYRRLQNSIANYVGVTDVRCDTK